MDTDSIGDTDSMGESWLPSFELERDSHRDGAVSNVIFGTGCRIHGIQCTS